MNQRNSSGLPLRAMVMVLLFLGVVFLLVGFQAMGSGDSDGDQSSSIATTTISATSSATSSPTPAPAKADVRVYNISSIEGVAESTANRLRDAGWNVTETGNLSLPEVTGTTVFFSDAPGRARSRRRGRQAARGARATAGPRADRATAGRGRGGHRLGSCTCSSPSQLSPIFAVPVVALSACSAPEQVATSPGTTPSGLDRLAVTLRIAD